MVAAALRHRLTLAASLVGLLLVIGISSAQTLSQRNRGPFDPTWQRIQDRGYLVVGIDPSLPPFGELKDDQLTGLDPAIAREIGARLGLEVRFLLLSFDGLYDSLLLTHSDLVIAALRPDPMRTDRIRYSQPYFDAGHILVSLEGIADLSHLGGKKLAVEFASEGDIAARRVKHLTIVRYFTAAEAIEGVLEGEADAALVDRVSASAYWQTHRDAELRFSPQTIVPDPYVIAVHRQDWRLYEAVKDALARMQADGTLHRLISQWVELPANPS